MLRMLDPHALQALVRAKVTAREIAEQLKVSVRTIRRIVREGEVETGDDQGAERSPGRSPAGDERCAVRVQTLVLEHPALPPGEDPSLAEGGRHAPGPEHGISRAHGGARHDPDRTVSALRRRRRRVRPI
jgi:hypothetical protein